MKVFKKIISGGQTGADRAALDVAIKWGVPRDEWCPQLCYFFSISLKW